MTFNDTDTELSPLTEALLSGDAWLISDTHFYHENIAKYCDRPTGWQDLIIQNWQRLIAPSDIVLHLGDILLGSRTVLNSLIPSLPGRFFLLRGNHDRFSTGFYASIGITVVKTPFHLTSPSGTRWVFSHRPIFPLEEGEVNIHGHIHNHLLSPEESHLGLTHINMSIEVRDYRPWRFSEVTQGQDFLRIGCSDEKNP